MDVNVWRGVVLGNTDLLIVIYYTCVVKSVFVVDCFVRLRVKI